MRHAAAVDIEGFKDFEHVVHGNSPIERPQDDVKVFLARLETIDDAVEEQGFVVEPAEKDAVVPAIELDPKSSALNVL